MVLCNLRSLGMAGIVIPVGRLLKTSKVRIGEIRETLVVGKVN